MQKRNYKFTKVLQEFIRLESAGGLVLMATTVMAMMVANSPLHDYYDSLLKVPVEVRAGSLQIAKPLILWVNDGLMAVFFLLVGMELKREILQGHLSSFRQALLPFFAAIGGMIGPAIIYYAFNRHDPIAMKGWAIPTATDIAFALGIVSLLGPRVPPALKAFLLSVAIFDDLGAIIIIAMFYTAKLSPLALVLGIIFLSGLALLNRSGVTKPAAYIMLGVPLWIAILKSGVHATLAGVAVAAFIPLTVPGDEREDPTTSPLRHLEHILHPWVAFGILPVFAFFNAGVSLAGVSLSDLTHPVPMAIIFGLIFGKLVGIVSMSWAAVKLRVASLPHGTRWPHFFAIAIVCGIGFTMSLFIASLAFHEGADTYVGIDKLGILTGSIIAGLVGYITLRLVTREQVEES